MAWILIIAMAAVGAFDLWLVLSKKDTISQRWHRLLPKWADALVLVLLAIICWAIFGEMVFAVWMVGVICGHLLWYGK